MNIQFNAQPEVVCLDFRFQIDGTSDPDLLVCQPGVIDSIAYTATGVYTITLTEGYWYPKLITGHASVDSTGITDDVKFTSYTPSTGVVVLQGVLQDGSQAAAVITDDAWVHVTLKFCSELYLCETSDI